MVPLMKYQFYNLRRVRFSPNNPGKTRFLVSLQFGGIERPDAAEFEISARALMQLTEVLQKFQQAHTSHTGRRGSWRGRASLRVVKDDE
jgi:hypothetical protein